MPISTGALVALNIAQNGPDKVVSLDSVMDTDISSLTFEGPPQALGRGGVLASSAFTPTDTAPSCLEDVLTLRTKSDLVRAWRNGVAPELPGQNGLEIYDGAVLKRGVLSPWTRRLWL